MARRPSRKLAVILHADVVGSTALVQRDEALAHERIQDAFHRSCETIEAYGGTLHELRGDALVAEFRRASDAVCAAVMFQLVNREHNARMTDDIRPAMRVGVSMGEVVIADGTLTGAGVVLAQRLEQLADPGGVVVQSTVSETAPMWLPVGYRSLGEQSLKGFEQPVRAYAVSLKPGETMPAPEHGSPVPQTLDLPERPSIAVLAFTNMSGDPEQEYFSDGVAEDIITDLAKISGLFVIARNSTFSYKGTQTNVRTVSRELGARYILEGSVRKAGAKVRITAQLVDGTTGGHVWAERYGREVTDIFALQDEVTREIVSALAPKLTAKEEERLGRRETDNPQAHDYLLRGRDQLLRFTEEASLQAQSMFERALELDPQFSSAYSNLAVNYVNAYINQWREDVEQPLAQALELAERAVSLDSLNPHAHFALGFAALWARQHNRALAEAERAIEIAPNLTYAYQLLASIDIYAGRPRGALGWLRKAMRLDPHYRDMLLHLLGQAHFQLGEYEEAIDALRRRLIRKPDSDISRVLLAAAHGHLGQREESRAEWSEALRINPVYSLEHRRQVLPYENPADFETLVDGLRKAGLGV